MTDDPVFWTKVAVATVAVVVLSVFSAFGPHRDRAHTNPDQSDDFLGLQVSPGGRIGPYTGLPFSAPF